MMSRCAKGTLDRRGPPHISQPCARDTNRLYSSLLTKMCDTYVCNPGRHRMRVLFAIISIVPAFLLSQGPEFAQQYRQRLGGAVDEIATVVRNFEEDSQRSGFDRQTALQVMARNPDVDINKRHSQAQHESVNLHAKTLRMVGAKKDRSLFHARLHPGALGTFFKILDCSLGLRMMAGSG
jgi:Protein of unknown function (DUF2937)